MSIFSIPVGIRAIYSTLKPEIINSLEVKDRDIRARYNIPNDRDLQK
jgi:hypothetical protein